MIINQIKKGRPVGSLGKTSLNYKKKRIRFYLEKNVSVSSLANILGVNRADLYYFIKSRKLDE